MVNGEMPRAKANGNWLGQFPYLNDRFPASFLSLEPISGFLPISDSYRNRNPFPSTGFLKKLTAESWKLRAENSLVARGSPPTSGLISDFRFPSSDFPQTADCWELKTESWKLVARGSPPSSRFPICTFRFPTFAMKYLWSIDIWGSCCHFPLLVKKITRIFV